VLGVLQTLELEGADHRGGAAELIEFVKVRKGSVAAPKAIEFWEAIPLTNLGKIDKKAIRARFWRGQERMV
jgi:fatty-acyl-CoA synthase